MRAALILAALLGLFVAFAAVSVTADIEPCQHEWQYAFDIDEVHVSPAVPIAGQNITISFSGNLRTTVSDGDLEVIVNWYRHGAYQKVYEYHHPLCTEFGPHACPIRPGRYPLRTIQFTVPNIHFPDGIYSGRIRAQTNEVQEIACVHFDWNNS